MWLAHFGSISMESPFLNLSLLISYFGKVWEIVVIFSETRILLGIFLRVNIWEAEQLNRFNKIKPNFIYFPFKATETSKRYL